MQSNFYNQEEINTIGFKSIGQNVLISRKASIYGAENISIGSSVRIDDFCILSGNIQIGNYVHIAAGTFLMAGSAGIELHDFSGLSQGVKIYAQSDDYSGNSLTNPTIPDKYKNLNKGTVTLEKHTIIGANSIIMPHVTIKEGSAVGALSFVSKSTKPWTIYFGIPAKPLKQRDKKVLELEKDFLNDYPF